MINEIKQSVQEPEDERNPEICHICGLPAHTELVTDARIGLEWFQFCTNPKCMQYDQNITRERQKLETEARASAPYKRKHKRLWKVEIAGYRRQRKLRERASA
jgi:hypothetical protein